MLDKSEFTGKTVFVAGGTSGINLGIAKAFAAAGARVAVFSRSPERVETALASLRELGAEVMGFTGDVRDMGSVQEALACTYETWGSIDVLCSGAAGNFVAPAAVMSVNGFKSVIDIDLLGSFQVLRGAYPYLTKPGPRSSIFPHRRPLSQLLCKCMCAPPRRVSTCSPACWPWSGGRKVFGSIPSSPAPSTARKAWRA